MQADSENVIENMIKNLSSDSTPNYVCSSSNIRNFKIQTAQPPMYHIINQKLFHMFQDIDQ